MSPRPKYLLAPALLASSLLMPALTLQAHARPAPKAGAKALTARQKGLQRELARLLEPVRTSQGVSSVLPRLDRLIGRGLPLDAPDEKGSTPLTYALAAPDERIAALLLRRGANPRARLGDGSTVLHLALPMQARPATIRLLLRAGADPNARDADGFTPLMSGVACEDGALWRAMLQGGADAKGRDKDGTPVLSLAAALGNEAAVRELLAAGADPNARGKDGVGPLEYAALMASLASVSATEGRRKLSPAEEKQNLKARRVVALLKAAGAK